MHFAVQTVRRTELFLQILARLLQLGFLACDLVRKPQQPLVVTSKRQFLGFELALVDEPDLFCLTVQFFCCRYFYLRGARPELFLIA